MPKPCLNLKMKSGNHTPCRSMRSHSESFPYCLVKISDFMHFDNAQYIICTTLCLLISLYFPALKVEPLRPEAGLASPHIIINQRGSPSQMVSREQVKSFSCSLSSVSSPLTIIQQEGLLACSSESPSRKKMSDSPIYLNG